VIRFLPRGCFAFQGGKGSGSTSSAGALADARSVGAPATGSGSALYERVESEAAGQGLVDCSRPAAEGALGSSH
jgi:hypothetical protein